MYTYILVLLGYMYVIFGAPGINSYYLVLLGYIRADPAKLASPLNIRWTQKKQISMESLALYYELLQPVLEAFVTALKRALSNNKSKCVKLSL
jgi:hypothetical protein